MTACLKELHWLPVSLRIEFKIVMMVRKCLNGLAPSYIVELIHVDCKKRSLRSSTNNLLVILETNSKTFGDRTFAVSGES